ncbi:alpha-galactosidase [Embleya sp. NPDC001921]
MARIVLIGAGSITFAKNLLSDLLTYPELTDEMTVVLHDIDVDRLNTAEQMTRWMIESLGVGARVEAHLGRRRALAGADYVINEIAVGGVKAAHLDFEIPARYGLRQTIGDTLGIGGIFRALRTIPVMVGIGRDMAELCPNAVLINYSNPMSMVPRAVHDGTDFKNVVGVCHSIRDTEATLAGLVGIPAEEISFKTAGVNHQAFVLRFEHRGEDLYPRLDEVIEADPEMRRRVRVEMYRRFGYFPTESSEHGSEYLSWFLSHEDQVERFRLPIGTYLDWLQDNLDTYEALVAGLRAGEGVRIEPGNELASLIIHSTETGTPRVLHANVVNDGLITNLPGDAFVEVPCLVDKAGVQPTRVGALPPQLAALNRTYLNVGDLTVRAALEGRRDHVYHAAMLDPNASATLTLQQIQDLVDELIVAHGAALPDGIRN